MADGTRIEWTDATWNPITGCTLVSEGCRNCYAARLAATRLKHHPSRKGLARLNAAGEAKFTGDVRLNEQWLDQPLWWTKPRRVFVCAHGDLFHENVPDDWIDRVFAVMALSPQHTFQVLTKRPERARRYISFLPARQEGEPAWPQNPLEGAAHEIVECLGGDGDIASSRAFEAVQSWPLPNVWLGTSVEDQATADARIPHLLATPAAVRFVSAEPLLGPVDFNKLSRCTPYPVFSANAFTGVMVSHVEGNPEEIGIDTIGKLDWVIVGGESGPGARPMHPDWARALRDQCQAAGVPFFFKQWGDYNPAQPVYWEDDPIAADAFVKANYGADQKAEDWDLGVADAVDYLRDFPDLGVLYRDGYFYDGADFQPAPGRKAGCWWMERVGKAQAGRMLDGRTWDDMPKVRP